MLIMVSRSRSEGRRRLLRLAGLSLLLLMQFICLVLAQYSLTILLYVVGIFVFLGLISFFQQRNTALALSIISIIVIAIIAVALLGQLVLPGSGYSPDSADKRDQPAAEQVGLTTLGIRTQIWQDALEILRDAPEVSSGGEGVQPVRRIIGYGPETFITVSQLRFPSSLKTAYTNENAVLTQTENHFLYLMVTIGIVGLLFFLGILAVFFLKATGLLSTGRDPGNTLIIAGLTAAMVQYCAHILFSPAAIVPDMVFWLIMGLLVVTARLAAEPVGSSDGGPATSPDAAATHKSPVPANSRRWVAALIVVLMAMAGASLTLPSFYANLKLREGITQWSQGDDGYIETFSQAIAAEPQEAYYYGQFGYCVYSSAAAAQNPQKKAGLLKLSAATYKAGTGLEPYQAYWHYTLADIYMNMANGGDGEKLSDALKSYKSADVFFPGNAIILNKLALALMLNGNYAEAGRTLAESRNADGEWLQTIYYTGLLDTYERCYCSAGYCFVSPVEQRIGNVGPYISFCRQLSLYGGLSKLVEALMVYGGCHPLDWTGQALLGIAEVYDKKLPAAAQSFRRAVHVVPDEHAGMLKAIVSVMGSESRDFQPLAQDIADSLEGRIPGGAK